MNTEPSTEATPLLPGGSTSEPESNNDTPHSQPSLKVHSPRTIVLILSTVILLLSVCSALSTVPFMRLLEDAICQKYYATSEIDEALCKIGPVQKELARIQGWSGSLAAVVAIPVAFPYGGLADRIGRRPVLVICIVGIVLKYCWELLVLRFWQTIPLYTIILSSLFQIIGGGEIVGSAVLWTIFADVTDENTRASAFYIGVIGSLAGEFTGPLLAVKLMEWFSPWVPLLVTLITLPLASALIIFVPETLKIPSATPSPTDTSNTSPTPKTSSISTLKNKLIATLKSTTTSLTILKTPSITLLLLSFPLHASIILTRTKYLLQYISLRFHWSLASTGYILGLQGCIQILLFALILPLLSSLLLKHFHYTAAKKDYILLLTSTFLLLTGLLLLSLPLFPLVITGVVATALSTGLWVFARSLVTGYVDVTQRTQLYAVIGIMEALGGLFAGPAFTAFFVWGFEWGGAWMGLPWWWVAAFAGLVALGLGFVRVEERKGPDGERGGQEP